MGFFHAPSDNPFSFGSGYFIAFQSGYLQHPNSFAIVGFSLDATMENKIITLKEWIQNSNRAVSASTSTKTFSKKLEDYGAYVFFSYGGSYDNSDYCSCIMIFRTKGIGTITAFPLYKGALVSFSLDQSTNTVSLQCNVTTLIMGMYKIY